MKLSWIFCIVSRFLPVFLITCSTWFSIRRFFLCLGRWLVLAFPMTPMFTCAAGCVVVRVVVEGEWNCQACGTIGCWPTKRQYFRCGTPRYVQNGGAVGGKPRGLPREQNALGLPPPSTSTGNPTIRVPRRVPPRNQGTPLPVPVAGGGMSLPISFLQTIGLPQEVMSRVESKLAPPRQKEITDEKALVVVGETTSPDPESQVIKGDVARHFLPPRTLRVDFCRPRRSSCLNVASAFTVGSKLLG